MEAEEDENLNVDKPSLQVVDASDCDSHVKLESTQQKCELELEPSPVAGSESEQIPVSKNDDEDMTGENDGLTIGADLKIEKTDIVEDTEVLEEKVVDDVVEDTVKVVVEPKIDADVMERKIEHHVVETEFSGQNIVADMMEDTEVEEKVVEDLAGEQDVVAAVIKDTVLEEKVVDDLATQQDVLADVTEDTVVEEKPMDDFDGEENVVAFAMEDAVVEEKAVDDMSGEQNVVADALEEKAVVDMAGEQHFVADLMEEKVGTDLVGEQNATADGTVNKVMEEKAVADLEEEKEAEREKEVVEQVVAAGSPAETFVAERLEEEEIRGGSNLMGDAEKKWTEGIGVANEVEETKQDTDDGLQDKDAVLGLPNVVEETDAYEKGHMPEVAENINVAEQANLFMEKDSIVQQQLAEKEEEEVIGADLADESVKDEEVEKLANGTEKTIEVVIAKDKTAQTEEMDFGEDLTTKPEDDAEHDNSEVKGMAKIVDETTETEEMQNDMDGTMELEEMEVDKADMVGETTEIEEVEAVNEAEEMEAVDEAEEMEVGDEAEEMEMVEEASTNNGSKKKRGKNSKSLAKVPSKKKMEEDVCFICFDGGELVLCDRRGCPKAYHPSCVNRDEAFFKAKGRWNCGWHLCSKCEKTAYYMCFTCTFSLCKSCTKDAVFLCVRGNKGFCETCMKTIMLIEKKGQENVEVAQVDFDDKSSWEYLFKDYWTDLKGRLSITFEELTRAKNPRKGSDTSAGKLESADELYDANADGGSNSDSPENLGLGSSKKRKTKKRLKSHAKERDPPKRSRLTGSHGQSATGSVEWASRELLEFVMHMRNGDKSVLSQFDVQALLLEYIKRNKLRDPRRKSQIICDSRFENLFGKPRVGHFEMLKLLESHFLIKEDSQVDDFQGSVVDTEASQLEVDVKAGKDRKRKARKRSDGRGPCSNLEDYAAIDIHNISLIYLKRSLVEDLLDDMVKFHDKVVGSFVRIRISGSAQKHDLYRLVQVVGTCKAGEPYKVGKKITDTMLEILNLNKTEIISADIISNQEFTEEECKRLRQSIKCGLINRLTVGDVHEKTMALQEVRVKDWLETEIVRLSHLRDRASEKGRRKELRECVEKLQLLKTPEERQRRLEETPEIHVDPNMDPNHESEEEEETEEKKQESFIRPRGTGFGNRTREPISPQVGGSAMSDNWTGMRNFSTPTRELNRNLSNKGFYNKVEDSTGSGEIVNENSWDQGRETDVQSRSLEKQQHSLSSETIVRNTQPAAASSLSSAGTSQTPVSPATKINESEKMWHYKDPSGKIQGPFSITQLRKWSITGYFPSDLRIWKTAEEPDDSILLNDALAGKFEEETPLVNNSHHSPLFSGKPHGMALQQGVEVQNSRASIIHGNLGSSDSSAAGNSTSRNEVSSSAGRATTSIDLPKYSTDYNSRNDSTNLPSPTPSPSRPIGRPAQPASLVLGLQHNARFIAESPTPKSDVLQMHSQSVVGASVLPDGSMNPAADIKGISANLQSLVQSINNRNPSTANQGWGSSSVSAPEMNVSGQTSGNVSRIWGTAQSPKVEQNNSSSMPTQLPHSQWGDPPSTQNSAPSYNSGTLAGNFSTGYSSVPQADPWRPSVPANQPIVQASASANLSWGMVTPDNQITAPRPTGMESQNTGWGPIPGNPNMGWAGQVPGNANLGWVAPGQNPGPGNVNPIWGPTANAIPGWVPHNQMPAPPVNMNQGWIAPPAQALPPGNTNSGWGPPPTGNQTGMWGSEQSNNVDRTTSQGGNSGYGGGKPWNRQSAFVGGGGGGGGSSSGPPLKGQRVCNYHKNGHCRKGAACDYLHT